MLELARSRPTAVFQVVDGNGRPIGQVVRPISATIVGCGAGTVLLVREPQRNDERARACA